MKKSSVLLMLIFVLSFSAKAQKQDPIQAVRVPVDSITKLITYEGVVEVRGEKADVLYKRGMNWFKTFYKNPAEVIRENDSLKFKITGKPRFKISNLPDKEGLRTDGGLVQYTITFAARDGRFKYEITEFNQKQTSYFPCERWIDPKSPGYTEYLNQLDQYANDLIKNLKNSLLTEKPVKNKDKW